MQMMGQMKRQQEEEAKRRIREEEDARRQMEQMKINQYKAPIGGY